MPQNIELRDYQVEIVDKACDILSAFRMVYLAMEVRTGKTLTSLAIAEK
jgi:superfamily II DNA or RNA helicase